MARVALSVPEILVNDVKITLVPNSFSYDKGESEITVRAASAARRVEESGVTRAYPGRENVCRAFSAEGPLPLITRRMKSFHIELTYG